MGALQDCLGFNLGCAQGGSGIGGEEGVTGSSRQDDNATLFKVAFCTATDVRLGHFGHFDRTHHTGLLSDTLESILQCEAVHHGCQHSHEVGLRLVHPLACTFEAAPKVSATDNNGDIGTDLFACFANFSSDLREDVCVKAKAGWFSERLARKLEHNARPTRP